MNKTYELWQITAKEKALVGNKIFFLSQLFQDNFPVFPGFVLDSSVLQKFIEDSDSFQSLNSSLAQYYVHKGTDKYKNIQSAALNNRHFINKIKLTEDLQNEIYNAALKLESKYLIIRPSLAVPNYQQGSFGLITSQVCSCSSEAIINGIKQVWADLFSAKSLFYWSRLGTDIRDIRLAILVQPLKEAIASGTVELISSFPYGSKNKTVPIQARIIANWGLGHSIHRGEVEPDRYLIDLTSNNIIDSQIGIKSTAYRLAGSDDADILAAYSIPTGEKAVLESNKIYSLIELIKNTLRQIPQVSYFEWILLKDNANRKKSHFYLTQLNYLTSALEYDKPTELKTQPSVQNKKILFTAIGAAPGKVTASVVNYASLNSDRDINLSEAILVAKSIQPQDIHLLHNVKGIITETGGKTSHSAIIARELGIPAVVSATNALKVLNTGDWITLDGNLGTVSRGRIPSSTNTKDDSGLVKYYEVATENVPLATQLMVNLSQPNLIEQAVNLPVDGIGLLRGEFMISELLSKQSLEQWLQDGERKKLLNHLSATINKFTDKFAPKPVYYRSLDFPLGENQQNSVMGNRGTYAYVQNSLYFKLELAALKTIVANQQNNVRLILPFVRSIREWQFCLDLVKKAGLTEYPNFQLWIMAEVPSVIFLLPEYIAAGVQGIVIGMNDLTQLILGVDREQEDFIKQGLNSNSPAVEKAIALMIETAKAHDLPCSICLTTNMQSPNFIDKLISWGITSISVEIQSVADTYLSIAKAEKRLLMQERIK